MVEVIRSEDAVRIIAHMADKIEENRDYLSELDAAIGDGDHGVSMVKSFRAVREEVERLRGKDIGTILRGVAMALISAVGGAMGPLFGTAFLRASQIAAGKQEIDLTDLVNMFEAAEAGVRERGKANVGDKTMLDAIHPAVVAIKEAAAKGSSLLAAVERSVAGAEAGMKSTIPLVSKVGRSSRLGERTLGHQDPGATSCYLLLKAFYEALESGHR